QCSPDRPNRSRERAQLRRKIAAGIAAGIDDATRPTSKSPKEFQASGDDPARADPGVLDSGRAVIRSAADCSVLDRSQTRGGAALRPPPDTGRDRSLQG